MVPMVTTGGHPSQMVGLFNTAFAPMKNAGKFHRLCIMTRFKSDPLPVPVRTPLPSAVNGCPDSHQRDRERRPGKPRGTTVESILNVLIPAAMAQTGAPSGGELGLMNLLFPIILIGAFYFLLIRPQTKRAKEHKQMVDTIKKGDEIVSGGGVLSRVTEVGENFVQVEIAENVQIRIQKQSVSSLMPKGTYKGTL